ncbi:pectinesterase inhibitor-like [Arachis hypogaea]|uniref:Pectinesterase inhibitor domain-containing protein n=3 Tax=Arachis TaxID=3817 RepID=A0A444YVI4_ARAHY|nr:pectinesterase inhibitor-like [Arachis hypogaea]RYR05932.1 hypothetical protein Ahy_B06g085753 isoform A [Arachis hypogaea]
MAHSILTLPLLFLSFTMFSSSLLCSARTVKISDVCSKHPNPYNCNNILNSVPGASLGADLNSLSKYVITSAHVYAFDTITLVHNLTRSINDKQLKQRYQACSMDYDDVLLSLTQAQQSFVSGDYKGMKSNGQTALKDVQDCDWKPGNDQSDLPNKNKYLEDVINIIIVFADFLAGVY